MKVKILSDDQFPRLEEYINKFIKDKKVIDIKYNCNILSPEAIVYYDALIMYEEEK